MNTMVETVANDRPPAAGAVSRRQSAKSATASASALALHLDCSRTYIDELEAEGVIQRQGDGFRSTRTVHSETVHDQPRKPAGSLATVTAIFRSTHHFADKPSPPARIVEHRRDRGGPTAAHVTGWTSADSITCIKNRFWDLMPLRRDQKLFPHFGEAGTAIFAVEEVEYSGHDPTSLFELICTISSNLSFSLNSRCELDYAQRLATGDPAPDA